jgi:hypothetical protein
VHAVVVLGVLCLFCSRRRDVLNVECSDVKRFGCFQ